MDKDLKDLLEEQNKAFDEFKKSNDELLKAKAEGKAVSELEAKVGSAEAEIARLSKELDEVAKKANRPGAAGNDEKAHIEADHKAGWLKWIRKGDDAGLSGQEAKAISVGTQADGGYAVPVEQDREILRLLREQSPMRQVCRVVTIGTEDFRKLVNLGGTASGWVGEKAARSDTATAKFAELKPVFGEIYANPAVTQKALDDLAARGIGMIHTVSGVGFARDLDVDLERFFARGITNGMQMRVFMQTLEVNKAVKRKLPRIGGCFETALDGCFGSMDAALLSPYENTSDCGVLYYSDEKVTEFCKAANRAGLQIEMHAIGDKAFVQAVRAIKAALDDLP